MESRPYPIPKWHADTLKMEVDRLVQIGVLKKVNRSEWAAPSFIILKKDGTVRFINDFRELNKRIRRKPYPCWLLVQHLEIHSNWKSKVDYDYILLEAT